MRQLATKNRKRARAHMYKVHLIPQDGGMGLSESAHG